MNFNNILFLDIETVSEYESYQHLPQDWKELWDLKAENARNKQPDDTPETIYPRASFFAEFGKIICISCGYLQGGIDDRKLVLRSYCGHDEKVLLTQFADMVQKWSGEADKFLCAHNGKEFDYPYLCRRMVISGIEIPEALKISGKKPWEIRHLDTMELWRFGEFKNFTSLKLLAKVLDIPSPKDDIDGSQVNEVYWKDKDLNRIAEYCQKDVVTMAQILLRFHCTAQVKPENISIKYVSQNQF